MLKKSTLSCIKLLKKTAIWSLFLVAFACQRETIIFNPSSIISTGNLLFVKTIGGSKNEVANSVIATTDGGYAVLGYAQSKDGDITDKTTENFDFWALKFDANHQLEWNKTFGGSGDDRGNDIIQTSDGGFAILGFSESTDADVTKNAGIKDFWIAKLTKNGILSWEKSFGFAGSDTGISMLQTNNNGFLITGVLDVSASGGKGNAKTQRKHAGGDIWVIKVTQNGDLQWSRYFGGSFTDTAYGVSQTSDNGFIITGSSDSNDVDITRNLGSYDFWVLKISDSGTLVWEQSFGGSEIDEGRAITTTNDGNFVIVGDTRSSDKNISKNNGAADLWVIKTSSDGKILWEKSFGGSNFDVARSINKTHDGGFIISGSSRSIDGDVTQNNGQNDAWILKVNSAGNLLWQKTIGGSEIDFFYDAVQLKNGTIIAVGESTSNNGDILKNKGFSDVLIAAIQ